MKLHELFPNLFVSGHTINLPVAHTLPQLELHGVDIVMCVTTIKDVMLEEAWTKAGYVYVHGPLSDGKNVNDAEVERLAKIAERAVAGGDRVLVHCRAGRNRSCLVIARAMMLLTGLSADAVIESIRDKRPNAIANPAFVAWLQSKDPR